MHSHRTWGFVRCDRCSICLTLIIIISTLDILTANGESLKVAGKTIIEIQSDNFKCLSEAVVASNGFRNRDPVTPDFPLNIKLNFVTLDFDSVVAHVNFGMLTLQKVKPQYPIYRYTTSSYECFFTAQNLIRGNSYC
jgi:hypothetical protein